MDVLYSRHTNFKRFHHVYLFFILFMFLSAWGFPPKDQKNKQGYFCAFSELDIDLFFQREPISNTAWERWRRNNDSWSDCRQTKKKISIMYFFHSTEPSFIYAQIHCLVSYTSWRAGFFPVVSQRKLIYVAHSRPPEKMPGLFVFEKKNFWPSLHILFQILAAFE